AEGGHRAHRLQGPEPWVLVGGAGPVLQRLGILRQHIIVLHPSAAPPRGRRGHSCTQSTPSYARPGVLTSRAALEMSLLFACARAIRRSLIPPWMGCHTAQNRC